MKSSVEIFKTNVLEPLSARELIRSLKQLLPGSKVNFDLEDCDNILRIETSKPINTLAVARLMRQNGFAVTILS
ncbi:MAG: hypothetical protein J7539_14450 [Niabella sp.]|nr:hypothetical protein [Niabella sp.]